MEDLGNYHIYESRRKEDGRERHRLHVGLFTSNADAMRVVSLVRQEYPFAWVVRASDKDIRDYLRVGSLPEDDEIEQTSTTKIPGYEVKEILPAIESAPNEPRIRRAKLFEKHAKKSPAQDTVEVNWDRAGVDLTKLDDDARTNKSSVPAIDHYAQTIAEENRRVTKRVNPVRLAKKSRNAKRKTGTPPRPQSLSDTARVKHLSVELKSRSFAARLVDRFKRKPSRSEGF